MSESNSGKDTASLKTPMVYICGGKLILSVAGITQHY